MNVEIGFIKTLFCLKVVTSFFVFDNNTIICSMKDQQLIFLPRSIRRGRKRPFLIVFDSFDSDCIKAVFPRIVNDRRRLIRDYTELSSHSLNLYDREDFQHE
jgi:hypothetical protein